MSAHLPSTLAFALLSALAATPLTTLAATDAAATTQRVNTVVHFLTGRDLAYYDEQGQLHLAEVETGRPAADPPLHLNATEQALLRQQGIPLEPASNGRYTLAAGSHGYHLIQLHRATQHQQQMGGYLTTLTQGGALGRREIQALAGYLKQRQLPLTSAEQPLLDQALQGDGAALYRLQQQRGSELTQAHRQYQTDLLQVAADVAAHRYTPQRLQAEAYAGSLRFKATPLSESGKPTAPATEVNPFNAATLDTLTAFRPLLADRLQNPLPHLMERAHAAAAAQLRQQPILQRLSQAVLSRTGSITAALQFAAPALALVPVVGEIALATVGLTTFVDSYLNSPLAPSLQTPSPTDPNFAGTSPTLTQWGQHQNAYLHAIQSDLAQLGEQNQYQFNLMLETIDRHSQQLDQRLDAVSQRLDSGFTDLSQALLMVNLKQDRGLALQEAQFEDALQAGIKHYDGYLKTQAHDQLLAADQELTRAQARYENLLHAAKSPTTTANSDPLRTERLRYALASYYRTLVYAERAAQEPNFAELAVETFLQFTDRLNQPAILPTVLPIINQTYSALIDRDTEDRAGQRLTQLYTTLIRHALAQNRHKAAQTHLNLLLQIRHDPETAGLAALVRYLTGEESLLAAEGWPFASGWQSELKQREQPRSGTLSALLACAESAELAVVPAVECPQSVEQLTAAAAQFDNSVIHRYLIRTLIERNRLSEAEQMLQTYYIPDPDFRIKQQLNLALLQRDRPEQGQRYCRLSSYVLGDTTFSESLRRAVTQQRQQWGQFCAERKGS